MSRMQRRKGLSAASFRLKTLNDNPKLVYADVLLSDYDFKSKESN